MRTSWLVAFYLGKGLDASGRMISEVLSFDDEQCEHVHDYIQWLFPLKERSAFNSSAPLATVDDIAVFHKNPIAKKRLLRSFARMLEFYGFIMVTNGGIVKVVKSKKFVQKSHNWLTPRNHNFLRITRILKSLVLLGCGKHAAAFLQALERVYKNNPNIVGEESLDYWRNAVCSL